jgi:hypothetical protein
MAFIIDIEPNNHKHILGESQLNADTVKQDAVDVSIPVRKRRHC